jgi:hypothetical protein
MVAMKKNAELYDFTQNAQGTIYQAAFTSYMNSLSDEERANRPAPPTILQLRGGYAESPGWILVQALEFAPAPLTVETFRVRAVYSAPDLIHGFLELMASESWFDRVGDAYSLTDAGRIITDGLIERRNKAFANFDFCPEEAERGELLLSRIIDASLKVGDPPGVWCLAHSVNRARPDVAPKLDKIVQYFSDLNAFRDDSHMAAYRHYDVSGRIWEAFNFVYGEKAANADDLFDQLAYRGWTRLEWGESLSDLENRGWIYAENDRYFPTDDGQAVFSDVERRTDDYFYAPWDCLSDDEFDELLNVLQSLNDKAQAILNA